MGVNDEKNEIVNTIIGDFHIRVTLQRIANKTLGSHSYVWSSST